MNQPAANTPTPDQAALSSVNDILKLLTTLATGALVFSVGLLAPASTTYPDWVKWVLAITWFLFFVAAASGVYAQSLVPLQIRTQHENINECELRGAAIVLEVCFFLGVLGLALTLIVTLFSTPTRQGLSIETPLAALQCARASIGRGQRVLTVDTVELIKGLDTNRIDQSSWHVRMQTKPKAPSKQAIKQTIDIYLNPLTANIYIPSSHLNRPCPPPQSISTAAGQAPHSPRARLTRRTTTNEHD
jgi:hypothetical protein